MGYPSIVSDHVIEKLRSLNYVNDESFARDWALSRAQSHGYGPRRIEQELRTKGIVQAVISEVIRETLDQCDEKTQAKRLLTKQFLKEHPETADTIMTKVMEKSGVKRSEPEAPALAPAVDKKEKVKGR